MPEERPLTVTFRRGRFFGDFANVDPKWHLARPDGDGGKWGTFQAWCGYTRSNIMGDLQVSRSKSPKPVSATCGKCITALGKHEAREAKKARAASE